jgi:hypothetical protein
MAVIDALQAYPREVRALGLATAFLKMCNVYKVAPNDVFSAASSLLSSEARPEFRAIEQYIRDEGFN